MTAIDRLRRFAAIALLAAMHSGCASMVASRQSPGEASTTIADDKAAEAIPGFTVPASMNDTWNTVGQVLVRTDGVIYESRAQMLGIYGLRYRGERFLIRTQAVVMRTPADGMATRVFAMELDGKPKQSKAAIELLELLREHVPREIGKYTLPIELKGAPKGRQPKPKGRQPKR